MNIPNPAIPSSNEASSATEEVLDAEYTEEVMGGEVPVPDDLLDEGSGSPRYQLPDELVRYKYDSVPVQTVPQQLALNDRIVVAIPRRAAGTTPNDLGEYESVISVLEKDFPLRTARLRALNAAAIIAQDNKIALIDQRDTERRTINWRNSVNNHQVDVDLGALKTGWEATRAKYHEELQKTQDALIQYRMQRQTEIEKARTIFWEVRDRSARLRDEQQFVLNALAEEAAAEQAVRDREARDRTLVMDEKTIAEREEQRASLRDAAAAADLVAQEAEAGACQEEDAAIERRNEVNTLAWENYQRLLQQTHDRIEAGGETLRAAAEEVEVSLLDERRDRETWLHDVQKGMLAEGQDREKQLHQAQLQAANAAAKAGLSPGDAERGHRVALEEQLTEDAIAGETATSHLTLEEPKRNQHLWESIAQVALGCVFGASLGLLLGAIDISPEGLRKLGASGVLLLFICVGLGIFVYYMMGRLARRAAGYASEEFHAAASNRQSRGTAILLAFGTALLLGVMIGLEATVERYGIVQSVMTRQMEDTGVSGLTTEMRFVYWAIALVFAAPFVIYHAYEGTSETRRILGLRRRREALVAKQHEASSDPRTAAVTETQENLRTVRKRRDVVADDFLRDRAEAERRIEEIDRLLHDHPAIVRWHAYAAERDALLSSDPLLKQAKLDWDKAQDAHQNDPAAIAARQRANVAHASADDARRRADLAESSLLRALQEAGRGIIASAGVGLAQAIGDQMADGLEGAVDAVQAAATSHAGPLGHAAAPLLSLLQQSSSASPKKDVETREESMARERWDSLRNAISHDPQMKFYQSRISSLKTAIHGADTQYGKRRKQLFDQKRAIELRLASSEESNRASAYFDRAIDEEDLNTKASLLAFEEEWQRLNDLAEFPRFLRWYMAWGQRRDSRVALRRQVLAIQSVKSLAGRGVVDASSL